MTLFVFDYNDTLNTVRSPVAWVAQLRSKHPGCKVVLWTGYPLRSISQDLLDAMDVVWVKQGRIRREIEKSGWSPDEIIIVDDDKLVRRLLNRDLRRGSIPYRVLDPTRLAGLLR